MFNDWLIIEYDQHGIGLAAFIDLVTSLSKTFILPVKSETMTWHYNLNLQSLNQDSQFITTGPGPTPIK